MDIKGKKILFLGDSITEGVGTTSDEKRFFEIVARETGAICKGYGIGGTRIARNRVPSENARHDQWFNSRVETLDKDADIVVIFGGTNDYGHGDAPLGTVNDYDEYTFYGALNVLYDNIKSKFPNSNVIVLTPTHRINENRLLNEHNIRNLTNLKGYVDIIKEVANKFNFTVFDLYNELGINPENANEREIFMPDGLHPSDEGNKKIAELFISKIKAI